MPLGWCWKPVPRVESLSWQTVHYCWVSGTGSYILYIGSSLLAVPVSTKQSTKRSTREPAKFNNNPPCRAPFFVVSGVALPNCSRPGKARQFNPTTILACVAWKTWWMHNGIFFLERPCQFCSKRDWSASFQPTNLHTAFLSSSPTVSLKTQNSWNHKIESEWKLLTYLLRVTSNNWHSIGMLSGTVSGKYPGTYLLPSGKQT